jgi:flagellar biosynthetic protein FliO
MGGSGSELPGLGSSLAVSFISLGLVCVCAYLVLRWLGRKGVGCSSAAIRVLGRCYLEPRRAVYLIESAGRCFLLGVGDGPVTLIAEVDRAAIAGAGLSAEPGGGAFADVLSKILRRRGP